MSSIPFLVSLSLAAWGIVAAGQDLREQIRKHGNVEVLILKEYSRSQGAFRVEQSKVTQVSQDTLKSFWLAAPATNPESLPSLYCCSARGGRQPVHS